VEGLDDQRFGLVARTRRVRDTRSRTDCFIREVTSLVQEHVRSDEAFCRAPNGRRQRVTSGASRPLQTTLGKYSTYANCYDVLRTRYVS
jgi:hypothetical protein